MPSRITPAAPDYGHRLMPVTVDETAQNDPDRVYFYIPRNNESSQGFETVTAKAFANAINRLCWWIESHFEAGSKVETIGYVGQNDLRYFMMMLAATKTGHKLLLSSPRNGVQAHTSLIEQSKCKFWFTSQGIANLEFLGDLGIPHDTVPGLSELLKPAAVKVYRYEKQWDEGRSDVLALLHTSGSTGVPKLVPVYHESIAVIDGFHLLRPVQGKQPTVVEWTGTKMLCAMPLFHVAGTGLGLVSVVFFNWTIVFPPTGPVMQHVIEDVLDNIELDSAFMAPSTINDLAKSPRAVEKLSKLKFITSAGGPISKSAGDLLNPRVQICGTMGFTEGILIPSVDTHPDEWAYFNFHPEAGIEMRPHGDGLFELVFVRKENIAQTIFITFPHLQVYETRDLYSPHPTIPNLWKYEMRRDDLVVMSNGEKFNPLAAELMLSSHPSITLAYITGRGRFQAAALLYSEDDAEEATIIDKIWPTVETMNKILPAYAQIHRDLVLVVRTPFPRTPKGTVARNQMEKVFAQVIDDLYERSSNSVDDFSSASFHIDGAAQEAVVVGVREAIQMVSGIADKLDDNDNIFTKSFDSLHAIRLTRLLNSAIQPTITLEVGTVYRNPSITQLSNAIWAQLHEQSTPDDNKKFNTNSKEITYGIIAKNLSYFEQPRMAKSCVVITGTTGSIGPYLLDMLCKSDQVAKVWCFNRSEDAPRRQVELAEAKGLSPDWKGKAHFIQYDVSSSDTPMLDQSVLEEIKDRATTLIHNAWEVNFNIPLSSFEPQFVGLRRLVDLCRETRHKIQFHLVSSISTAMNWSCELFGQVPEAKVTDLDAPINGYGASKLVAEHLLGRAANFGVLDLSVLRVGQVAGPVKTAGGVWTRRDWVPAIIDASAHLRLLPSDLGSGTMLDWIPVDLLAEIIGQLAGIDSVQTKTGVETYYNLLNPRKANWSHIVPSIKARLEKSGSGEVQIVPFQQWIHKLRDAEPSILSGSSESAIRAQQGYKLLSFFQMMVDGSAEARGGNHFGSDWAVSNSAFQSKIFANLDPVSTSWFDTWLEQWGY